MDDLISRQAAIDALAKHEKSNGHNYTLFVDIVSECAEIIRDLPSAQPEVTEEAVKEYCRKRCLCIVDGALLKKYTSVQPTVKPRRYAFGNDEFNLEAAYHDCKLVFDGITDDDSFQEADTGLILYYANEIIYALQKALRPRTLQGGPQ